jgi:CBS domain-containing protein
MNIRICRHFVPRSPVYSRNPSFSVTDGRAHTDGGSSHRGRRCATELLRRSQLTTLRGRYPSTSGASIRVGEVMHRGVVTCKPDASLDTVARLLAAHRIHAVAVPLRDDAKAWGIVSDLDLVAALTGGRLTATAGDLASAPSVSVGLDDTLAHAMQLMSERSSHHVIVLGRGSQRPIGVVSTLDVADAVAELLTPDSLGAWLDPSGDCGAGSASDHPSTPPSSNPSRRLT